MELDKEKKFPMFTKQTMMSVAGEEVEVAVPLGSYSIRDLEEQQNIASMEIQRNRDIFNDLQKKIDLITDEQTRNPVIKEEVKEVLEVEPVKDEFNQNMILDNEQK